MDFSEGALWLGLWSSLKIELSGMSLDFQFNVLDLSDGVFGEDGSCEGNWLGWFWPLLWPG
jgi:hypothetical protein